MDNVIVKKNLRYIIDNLAQSSEINLRDFAIFKLKIQDKKVS